jgi:GNAT superfamily N-acetyltransferase
MNLISENDYKAFEEAIGPLWDVQNAADGADNSKEQWAFVVRDDAGSVVCGVGGHIKWDWMYVQHLIVAPELRGKGAGRELMQRAEELARSKGVVGMHLKTLGYQAKDFYLKCGFEVNGVIEDMPKGTSHYTLVKRLG